MSSILSAQNLQTLRRRNSVRRWPFSLSLGFLSRLLPRPPPPPPPERPCPNAMATPLSRQIDRLRSRPVRRQDAPRPAAAVAATRASHGGARTRSAVWCSSARRPSALDRRGRPYAGLPDPSP